MNIRDLFADTIDRITAATIKAVRLTVLLLAGGLVAQPVLADPGATALADWSHNIWSSALEGRSAQALELLNTPPAGTEDLQGAISLYRTNLAKREDQRAQRVAEVQAELSKHAQAQELLKGLFSAIELQALKPNKSEVLFMPEVQAMVKKAQADAQRFEAEGKWLDAHALYNRLHLLHEEAGTFEADLKRLNQRLVMLRLYVPERLHEVRNAQRIAEGEDPLPPFNNVGEDWHEKLAPIDDNMVVRALATASGNHVDRVPMNKMLAGGYRALHTMATTSDLVRVFPGLGDDAKRNAFLKLVDDRDAELSARERQADYRELVTSIRQLVQASASGPGIDTTALLHEFCNGAMGELDDFTSVIWPYEIDQFLRTTDGTFKGVGIQITLNDAFELKVVTPLEGTPAGRAGLRAGDLIRKVNNESTLGMSVLQAVDRITGPEGSEVTLSIERPGTGPEGASQTIEYKLRREVIPIYSVKGWKRTGPRETDWDWFIDPASKIGYARITQFNSNTTAELRAAIKSMKESGLNGLVLDLRGNPGGLLSEAVGVSSLFVDSGVVVTQEDNQGHERERQSVTPGMRVGHVPVAVLINGGSASASEIVAGALQDHHAAVIVGDRSFGKGSVQNVFQLAPKAVFKLTTQYYRLPGRDGQPGRLIHRRHDATVWGIDPDVMVEVLPKQFADAFELRQNADIVEFDAQGKLVERPDAPDPQRLLTDGLDPQLETSVLLIQSQVLSSVIATRAEAAKP